MRRVRGVAVIEGGAEGHKEGRLKKDFCNNRKNYRYIPACLCGDSNRFISTSEHNCLEQY